MAAEALESFITHHCGVWEVEETRCILYRTKEGGLGAKTLTTGAEFPAGRLLAYGFRVGPLPVDTFESDDG
jgi:hypothetical protein